MTDRLPVPKTEDAAALITCLAEAENFALDGLPLTWGLDQLGPHLPMWPTLLDQLAAVLRSTVAMVLAMNGQRYDRAAVAVAWAGARFRIRAELGEKWGPEYDLHGPFAWLDHVLIERGERMPDGNDGNPHVYILVAMYTAIHIVERQLDRPWSWLAEQLLAG